MSTNLNEAGESLQVALRKCNELEAEIKRILSAENTAIDAGLSKGDVTYIQGKLEKALKKNDQTRHNLIKAGKYAAPHKDKLDAIVKAPIVCGC